MKNLSKNIEQLQSYFIGKLRNKDFRLIHKDSYIAEVIIDEKFKFTFWLSNGPEYCRLHYGSSYHINFMYFELSIQDQSKLYNDLISLSVQPRKVINELSIDF